LSNAKNRRASSERVEESIVSARAGSFTSLGQLLDHYRDYLLHIANSELESDLAAKVNPSDVVQDTFLQAAKRFRTFRGQTDADLRKWLRRILINKLRDTNKHYFQRQRRALSLERPLDIEDLHAGQIPTNDALVACENQAIVQAALQTLPEVYRRVIELRHFERQSLKEIGQQLDRSPEAVRKLWCRALEVLTRELAEHRPE
jgi:RNA polymerase sigma-70 factor, ECF subfamily